MLAGGMRKMPSTTSDRFAAYNMNITRVMQSTRTEYQREKFAKENLPYVKPQEHPLDGCDTFQYVPITSVLQNLFMSESFRGHLQESERCEETTSLCSFRDGLLFERKTAQLIPEGSQFTLFIVLYSDELEIVNPLGSKRGQHKLFVAYFSVVNIHPRYRSQLSSIHVAVIAKYANVKKHGLSAVMKLVLTDINLLRDVGFIVKHCNTSVKVTAMLIAFCGDNLSMNNMGGYTSSFSRGRPCWFCTASVAEFESIFDEGGADQRNEATHKHHMSSVLENTSDSRTHGVKERSPLLDVSYFEVTLQLPPDLMHDLLEGTVPHVLQLVLHGLLSENTINYTDLDRVTAFNYGRCDRKSKPEPVSRAYVQGQASYKGTAAQKWCLFSLLSVRLGDIIEENDAHWEIYLKLKSVVQLVFAEEVPCDHVAHLADEIRYFLTSFATMYPGKIIQKMHFLVHYPRLISELGPLKQYCCMRFEAKHQYIKPMAIRNKNFKNICRSVTARHQLLQSFDVATLDYDTALETTKSKLVHDTHLPECARDRLAGGVPIWEIESAKIDHCKYRTKDIIVLAKGDPTRFGQISMLLVCSGSLFIVVRELETVAFNRHLRAYTCQNQA
ncbi:uncharacterized protein LOC135386199 [Ornithodoros turicata]|uniref:uncharacterized protein LOC135386199 n=1 Tax=Ornithodoros turicata TaxID=34597 RepID=UPI003139B090